MGTENLKKPGDKPSKNIIPFTDHSIDDWKPPVGSRSKVGFVLSSITKGLKVVSLAEKYWELNYTLNGKEKTISLGKFIPEVRGTEVISGEMLALIKKHKNKKKTKWLTDPKVTTKELDKKEEDTSQEPTVNKVIEDLCLSGFPKALIKDEFLASSLIRTHIRFLIGSNKRTKCLSYGDDKDGDGKIFFAADGPQSFPELFKKFPPGVGIRKSRLGEVSLYDSPTGLRPIRELTPTVIDQYLSSMDRSEGQQENILLALQCLWTFACKQKVFGENIPNNPTSRRDKRIIIMKSRHSKAPGRAWNNKIFKPEDLPILDRAFVKLSNKFPFQAEALNFMAVTGRRMEETLKIRTSMITEDEDGNPIIRMPGSITKARREAKVDITDPVQKVLNRLKVLREGEYKRFFAVPWLFPTLRTGRKSAKFCCLTC